MTCCIPFICLIVVTYRLRTKNLPNITDKILLFIWLAILVIKILLLNENSGFNGLKLICRVGRHEEKYHEQIVTTMR